jgi:hypothetical protein
LGPTISEGGLAADALTIVLSGTSADPINEAKGVVRAALAPLVAEVEDETSNVAAVKRRLGELESALSRCGHKGDAAMVSIPLTAPPKIAELLTNGSSGDAVADQVGEDSAVADRCAESVATWAASTRALAELVESTNDESNPLYFSSTSSGCDALHSEVERWRAYSTAVNNAQTTRKSASAVALGAILKRNRRFVAAAQLDDGVTGPLQRAADACRDAKSLLSSLPLDRLESAASLTDLTETSDAFFRALGKLKATRPWSRSH